MEKKKLNTKKQEIEKSQRMPAIFLAHGSPLTLDDNAWMNEWNNWSKSIPQPDSILMISAHWEANPISISAIETVPLYYDFWGFPEKFYKVKYPAPGAPELAKKIESLLTPKHGVVHVKNRGLDHGAFVPLIGMYPKADVPVLQLSLPTMDPEELFKLGQQLAPLRDENVLIIGSGFITHNLRLVDWNSQTPSSWSKEFDSWIKDKIINENIDKLLAYRDKAPHVEIALPTHEHFVPLIVTQGTSWNEEERISFPIEGFTYGNFTKRSVQFG